MFGKKKKNDCTARNNNILSMPPNDKIRNHLVANPILLIDNWSFKFTLTMSEKYIYIYIAVVALEAC